MNAQNLAFPEGAACETCFALDSNCWADRKLRGQRPRHGVRLVVERLEDRCLLSGGYLQTNLVSDLPGLARVTDPNLVNPWGLSAAPTGPFWVSDNGTGVSTLYDSQGQARPSSSPLVVSIPGLAGSSVGTPTGTVFNGGPGFLISANGRSGSSRFLFATEDGLLAGWNPDVDATHAVVAVDNSSTGADYKGLALGTDSSGRTLLYATNFSTGAIDVFDQTFQAVRLPGAFTDPALPAGYAPFGIQNIDGDLYVTYAKQDATKYDDVAGAGNGFLDVFNGDGVLQQRLVSQGPLNAPWGLALAPAGFGEFGQDLLVGNFGDGRINVFDPHTGRLLGQVSDGQGNPITIDHLWGLEFGNGAGAGNAQTLFFSAGIDHEQHGVFGKLQSAQNIASDADSSGGPSANVYGTLTDPLLSDSRLPGTATQVDDYPLPPAGGTAPRGDLEVQPRTLPLLFPLKDSPTDLASALLTVTEGVHSPTAPGTPSVRVVPNGTGNNFEVTPTPSVSPQTASVGPQSAVTPSEQTDPVPLNSPGALDILLSLPTQPDVRESRNQTPVADTTSTRAIGDLRYIVQPGDNPLSAAVWLVAADRPLINAIQYQENSPLTQESPAATPAHAGSPKLVPEASETLMAAQREKALEITELLTVLLVAGGVCLRLGLEDQPHRRANQREQPHLAPVLLDR